MVDIFHQFVVETWYNLSFLGLDISITNSSTVMLLSLFLIITFLSNAVFFFSLHKKWIQEYHAETEEITKIQNRVIQHYPHLIQRFFFENFFIKKSAQMIFCLYWFLRSLAQTKKGICPNHLSVIVTIFFTVLMGNILGLVPGLFTFTSQIINNFVLALFVIIATLLISIKHHGWHFVEIFCPSNLPWAIQLIMTPIEAVSFLFRILSLTVRLFANMLVGHCILKIFASFCAMIGPFFPIPLALTVLLLIVECAVASLQAGLFALMSSEYIKQGIDLH